MIQKAMPGTSEWRRIPGARGTATRLGSYRAAVTPTSIHRFRDVLPATATHPRRVSAAIRVEVSTGWPQASGGAGHTCGIRNDHTLWCWGDNQWGELSNPTSSGTNDLTPSPTQVVMAGQDQTWVALTTGWSHRCGLGPDGSLWRWGNNGEGELGNPTTSGASDPNPTPLLVVR